MAYLMMRSNTRVMALSSRHCRSMAPMRRTRMLKSFNNFWWLERTEVIGTTLVRREFSSNVPKYKENSFGPPYHGDARQEFIRASLQNDFAFMKHKRNAYKKLPLKTILLLIAGSSSLTMIVYSGIQIAKFRSDGVSRSFMLPIWFSPNFLSLTTYSFPQDLKYIDRPHYEYLMTEMELLNSISKQSSVYSFIQALEEENIRYNALEVLSLNSTIRKLFKLPLSITLQGNKFQIWIEPKFPTVSGLQVDMQLQNGQSQITTGWAIKLVRFHSMIDDFLTQIGLKLDKVNAKSDYALDKTIPQLNHSKFSKEYDIKFKGEFVIKDKSDQEKGKLFYTGVIDFDHINLNRGVKLKEIDMIWSESDAESIKYKVL